MDWPGDNHDDQNKQEKIRSIINHWSNLLSLYNLWEEEPSDAEPPHPQKLFSTGQMDHLPIGVPYLYVVEEEKGFLW